MNTGRLVELVLAVLLLGGGLWLYTRRTTDGSRYGSQGAVLLFAVAVIVGIHALGGLDYHPSQSELDAARAR
ncbi:hypothetical protein ACUXST_001463 [Sphingomonas sp. F9_3S_D5_B_2]